MINNFFSILRKTSLLKTIYFNLKYIPFKHAIKLPVLISNNFILKITKGKIEIPKNAKSASIRFGYGTVDIFDRKRSKGIFKVYGKIIFLGKADIGHGSKIYVGKNGILELGENFQITAESQIIAEKKIKFGQNNLISWECIFMDTDTHKIYNNENNVINDDKEIIIGDKVWIGCRSTILKGSKISNNSIIGANSVLSKILTEENSIYTGNPIKNIKNNITWQP